MVERALERRHARAREPAPARRDQGRLAPRPHDRQVRPMQRVFELVRKSPGPDQRADHAASRAPARSWSRAPCTTSRHRADGPFVPVNCGAIPEELMESELFGHVKGAFTGAADERHGHVRASPRAGRCSSTRSASCPWPSRSSCCAPCKSGSIRPVGGNDEVAVDVRVVAATNRDLEAEVESGEFREDLYFRLNVVRDRAATAAPAAARTSRCWSSTSCDRFNRRA